MFLWITGLLHGQQTRRDQVKDEDAYIPMSQTTSPASSDARIFARTSHECNTVSPVNGGVITRNYSNDGQSDLPGSDPNTHTRYILCYSGEIWG